MTIIKLSDKFVPKVMDGSKEATIRAGRRTYPLGGAVLRTEEQDFPIDIHKVRYSVFGDLSEYDALRDGFETLYELKTELLRFYPELQPEDEVTIVEFSVKGTVCD